MDGLSVSADGKQLLLHDRSYDFYQDYNPVLVNLASPRQPTPTWLSNSLYAVFGPTRPEVAVMDQQREVTVWPTSVSSEAKDKPVGTPLMHLAASPDRGGVALSPDGHWLATIEVNEVKLWDRSQPQVQSITFWGPLGQLRSVIFSPDSGSLVSASADRSARVWTLKGLAPGQTLDCVDRVARRTPNCVALSGGHSAALQSAHFSPDGRRVVTASADNSIRVWDAATGNEWAALYRHDAKVNSALIGRCDACRLPLPEQQRARTGLRLTADDETALKADAVSWLPRWLGVGGG